MEKPDQIVGKDFDPKKLVSFIHNDKFTLTEQRRELDLLAELDRLRGGSDGMKDPQLEAAIRLGHKTSATYNGLGVALMGVGRVEAALPHFRRAADLAPTDENVPFNLGNAFRALSRWREAIAAYQRSLALNPDFPDAHVNLGGLLIERGEFAAAMPHYHRAVELRPDSAVVHNNYASALASTGRYQDALQHVRRALEIRPGYPPALENLGRLERMGIR